MRFHTVFFRCQTFSHCDFVMRGVFMLRFYAARRFYITIFALQDVFSLRFSRFKVFLCYVFCAAGRFYVTFSRCVSALRCVFMLQDVSTLRFCTAGRFHTAILRCKAFLRCVFAICLSQSIHFLSQSIRFISRNIRLFVESQRVCHHSLRFSYLVIVIRVGIMLRVGDVHFNYMSYSYHIRMLANYTKAQKTNNKLTSILNIFNSKQQFLFSKQ